MNKSRNSFTLKFLLMVFLAAFFSASMPAQDKSLGDDRDRGKEMLSKIKDYLKRYYSLGQIMGIIATVLGELNDSHTYFIPPLFALEVDYGWTMQIVGERCFVSFVDKGSDAEAKGVKPGDEILEAGAYTVDRSNLWKF